jgi:hypothetical protein
MAWPAAPIPDEVQHDFAIVDAAQDCGNQATVAAITYLVERMIESGRLRRESDRADRRKVILALGRH